VVPAVDGVSIDIGKGETVGIVGESGCGKSVTALSIMRLLSIPPGKIAEGRIIFQGENLLNKSEAEMMKVRGNRISMIFQEPMTALNPVHRCGSQISEAIRLHKGFGRSESASKAIELLRLVGIPLPEKRFSSYPHQLSGGMRQRIMIAMALSCSPQLLIADEPTTALDVTIQAQILELMKNLKKEFGMAIMLISHDLGVIAEMSERVVVMYAGKVVEESDVISLFRNPLHPYTEGLLDSIPQIRSERKRLHVIEGVVPNPSNIPPGCRFHPRCRYVIDSCKLREPPLCQVDNQRLVACWLRGGPKSG